MKSACAWLRLGFCALTKAAVVRSVEGQQELIGICVGHQPEQPLREVIAALRAVVVRRRIAESAGWVAAASVAGVWLAGWMLGLVPARPSGDGWWLVLLAGVVAAVVSLLRGRRAFGEDHALARLLEGAFPQLRTDLRTLLDFAARPPSEAEGQALAASLQARVEAELVAVAPLVERAAPPFVFGRLRC